MSESIDTSRTLAQLTVVNINLSSWQPDLVGGLGQSLSRHVPDELSTKPDGARKITRRSFSRNVPTSASTIVQDHRTKVFSLVDRSPCCSQAPGHIIGIDLRRPDRFFIPDPFAFRRFAKLPGGKSGFLYSL